LWTTRPRGIFLALVASVLCVSSGCTPGDVTLDAPSLDDVQHRAMRACGNAWLNHGVVSDEKIQDGLAQGFIVETPGGATLAFAFDKGDKFVNWQSGIPWSRVEGGIKAGVTDAAADDLPAQAGRACLDAMLYAPVLPPELIADGAARGYIVVTADDPEGEFDFTLGAALYEWGASVQLEQIEQAVVDDME
jgi:hypothetical protein